MEANKIDYQLNFDILKKGDQENQYIYSSFNLNDMFPYSPDPVFTDLKQVQIVDQAYKDSKSLQNFKSLNFY